MVDIQSLPERHALKANEERSTYIPPPNGMGISPNNNRYAGNIRDGDDPRMLGQENTGIPKIDGADFVQLKSDNSSSGLGKHKSGKATGKHSGHKKRDEKKLRKLKPDVKYDEFLSFKSSQTDFYENLQCSQTINGSMSKNQ